LKLYADAISLIAREVWKEHFVPIIGDDQVEYMLTKFQSASQIYKDIKENGYIYFVANNKENDELIGYSAVVPQDDYLLFSKVYVHKNYRGLGILRSFLNEAIALCRYEYSFGKIRLAVNKSNNNAVTIYKHMGFATIDSVDTDIGDGFIVANYIMELILPPAEQNNARRKG